MSDLTVVVPLLAASSHRSLLSKHVACPFREPCLIPTPCRVSNGTVVPIESASPGASDGAGAHSKAVPVGAIVGAVAGTLVFIAALVFGLLWYRRKRVPREVIDIDEDTGPEPDPFMLQTMPFYASATDLGHGHTPSESQAASYKTQEFLSEQQQSHGVYATLPSEGGSSQALLTEHPVSSEVQGLRTELENLRRTVLDLHGERLEAPPVYEAEVH